MFLNHFSIKNLPQKINHMSTIQIRSIHEVELSNDVREKIIKQANFAGLQQNLSTGEIVGIKIGEEICQVEFNKEMALLEHRPPACSSDDGQDVEDISFSNRAELSALLNLEEPVSEAVFAKAKEDNTYLHNLLISKNAPEFLEQFLNNLDVVPTYPQSEVVEEKRTDELIINFGKAILKWGASGFKKVDEDTYQERLNACAGCDKLTSAPDKFIYNMLGKNNEKGMCSSCGCLVAKKALISTDTCPEASIENANVNRWGDPHEQD